MSRLWRRTALIVAILFVLSIGAVVLRQTDPAAHVHLVDSVRSLRESEQSLARALFEVSLQRVDGYASVLSASGDIDDVLTTLRRAPAMREPPHQDILTKYEAQATERHTIINRFISLDATFRASRRHVEHLAQSLDGRISDEGIQLITQWTRLLFLRLHEQGSDYALADTTQRLREFSDKTETLRSDIDALIDHSTVLVRSYHLANSLLDEILALSNGDLSLELYHSYMRNRAEHDRRMGFLLHGVYAVGLFCGLGLLVALVRLRHMSQRMAESNDLLSWRANELRRLSLELQRENKGRKIKARILQEHRHELERRVTERTKALAASEARLVDAIETLPEAFVLFDSSGRLIVSNAAYRNLSRVTAEHAKPGVTYEALMRLSVEHGVFSLDGLDSHSWLLREVARYHSVGRDTVRTERRFSDGRQFEIIERRTRDGGLVGLRIDVTEARRREAISAGQEKLAALGQLAGGVAHEINNLLQPALSFPELVRDRLPPEDEESRADLDLVIDSVRKAREVVRSVLLFARKEEVILEAADLSIELQSVLTFVKELLPPRITLESTIEASAVRVLVNKTQLTQVLTNLVINATHAIDDRGLVQIVLADARLTRSDAEGLQLDPAGRYLSLSIRDTGCGMDEATQRRIFEPFFTTKTIGQGTGLGLSVVFGILRGWKGAISVRSRPGAGSTFTLYIPVFDNIHKSSKSALSLIN